MLINFESLRYLIHLLSVHRERLRLMVSSVVSFSGLLRRVMGSNLDFSNSFMNKVALLPFVWQKIVF